MTEQPRDRGRERWRRRWLLPVAVFALAAAVFAPAIPVGFMLDDNFQVLSNPAVRDLDLDAIFTRGYWANVRESGFSFDPGSDLYRPLSTLSLGLSYAMWGQDAAPYHAENVVLHALASVLVLLLLRRWGLPRRVAAVAAVLFAVAPIHIEPIGSVVLRNELLAAIFGVSFLWWMARGRGVVAGVFLFAALLAKESAIALPVAAWIVDRVRRVQGVPWAVRYLPSLTACAIYLMLRFVVLGQLTLAPDAAYFGADASWLVVWLTMARFGVEHYLCGSLFGAPLVFDFSADAYPHAAAGDVLAWICLGFWVVAAALSLWFAVVRRSWLAAGAVLFMVLLGPTANVVTRIGVLGAGRLAYLPYLGLALSVALLAASAWRRARRARSVLTLVGVGLLAALVWQTERRLAVWRNPLAFYHDVVADVPRNAVALGFLGQEEFAMGLQAQSGGPNSVPGVGAHSAVDWFASSFHHLTRSIQIQPKNWLRLARPLAKSAVIIGRERAMLAVLGQVVVGGPAQPPPKAAEAVALRAWGQEFRRVRPAEREWRPIDDAAADSGLRAVRGPLTPAQSVVVRSLMGDSRFARALVADLGEVVPDLLIARSRLRAAVRWEKALAQGEFADEERAPARQSLDIAIASVRRIERVCRSIVEESGGAVSRQLYRRLAADLFAADYLRWCAVQGPRLEGLRRKI